MSGPALPVRRAAFGVALELEGIDLPALGAGVRAPAAAEPRTRVRRVAAGEITARWAGARPERARELRGHDGRLLLSVDADPVLGYLMRTPLDGRFLVPPSGLEVLCAPLARAARSWTDLLVGQLLPLVATLRGLEVLHASAVALDRGALLFTAPPGAGKTSAALRLVLTGARLLADDAVAIDAHGERLLAHPGAGALGVRRDEQRRLKRPERARLGGARRARQGKTRYAVSTAGGPVPVAALFLLRRTSSTSRRGDRAPARSGRSVQVAGQHVQPLGPHAGAVAPAARHVRPPRGGGPGPGHSTCRRPWMPARSRRPCGSGPARGDREAPRGPAHR